jgi:hypothetical protein
MDILPSGFYFLCDPCYVLKGYGRNPPYAFGEQWSEVLEQTNYFGDGGLFEYKEQDRTHKMVVYPTAYGDGTYYDQYGNEFGVDAGLIGLVPVGATDFEVSFEISSELTIYLRGDSPKFHKFDADGITVLLCWFPEDIQCQNKGGVLHFGHHVIDTIGDNDEYEY